MLINGSIGKLFADIEGITVVVGRLNSMKRICTVGADIIYNVQSRIKEIKPRKTDES